MITQKKLTELTTVSCLTVNEPFAANYKLFVSQLEVESYICSRMLPY